MSEQKPRVVVIGPKKFYDFFKNNGGRDEEWDFIGHVENVSEFWRRTGIEDENDPEAIDQNFHILITADVLFNPGDRQMAIEGGQEDDSLETLIASLAQDDSVLIMIAQFKPSIEAQLRSAINSSCQLYSLDPNINYWFIPKRGVNSFVDASVQEYIQKSSNRAVAQIISGEEDDTDSDDSQNTDTGDFGFDESNEDDDFVDEGRIGRVVAVTSAKGGSGKSSVAILLATYLAHSSIASVKQGLEERPLKVCLVDLDTRDSQLGFFIGSLRPNVSQIVARGVSHKNIQETIISSPRLKVDFILGPRRPRYAQQIPPTFYRDLITALRKEYDFVILDTSVFYLDPLLEKVCYPMADQILFVTSVVRNSIFGMTRWIKETTTPVEQNGSGISPRKIGIAVNALLDNVNMSPQQIRQACSGLPIITMIPSNVRLITHATNIQSMEKVLIHDAMRASIRKAATAITRGDYKLAKDFDVMEH